MIASLSGVVKRLRRESSRILLEVEGVGYEVLLPYFVQRALEEEGGEDQRVHLEIYYHSTDRQPRPLLIGFLREHEKSFFEKLLEVADIGPVRAAAALTLSISTIAQAIETGDVELLRRLPGIGERTASKIVATLQGKVAPWALLKDEGYATIPTPGKDRSQMRENVVEALVGLGYRRAEARAKVEEALGRNPGARDEEEIVREVFRGEHG